jgi:TonB family protein
MIYYFDSSALVKRYAAESGSAKVAALIEGDQKLAISWLAIPVKRRLMSLTCRCLNTIKLRYYVLSLLFCFFAIGLQAEILPEMFQGSFSFDLSVKSDYANDNKITSALVFTESTDGKQYTIYAHNLFFRLYPLQKYSIKGIRVQKQLLENQSWNYRQIVQATWPNTDPEDMDIAEKRVELWIKNNPDKPLLLISGLYREDTNTRRVIKIGGNVQGAELVHRVAPSYPQQAKAERISGKVILEVLVDEKGIVESIVPKSGHHLLIPAAVVAVQNWAYNPTIFNGEIVAVLATVTVNFQLR